MQISLDRQQDIRLSSDIKNCSKFIEVLIECFISGDLWIVWILIIQGVKMIPRNIQFKFELLYDLSVANALHLSCALWIAYNECENTVNRQ